MSRMWNIKQFTTLKVLMKEQSLEVSLWYFSLFNSNLRDRKTIKSGMKRVFHFLFHVLFFTCLYTNEFLSTDGDHKSTKVNLKILSYFYIITWTHAVIYYSLCAQLFYLSLSQKFHLWIFTGNVSHMHEVDD